jgi:hypothetical protein
MMSLTRRGAAASLRTIAGEKQLYAFYSREANNNKKEYNEASVIPPVPATDARRLI